MGTPDHDELASIRDTLRRLEESALFADRAVDHYNDQLAELSKAMLGCESRVRRLDARLQELVNRLEAGAAGADRSNPFEDGGDEI